MANKKDVYGLGSLTNPAYSSPQSSAIEQSFITGSVTIPNAGNSVPEISTDEMLQKRIDEVEQSIGCSIFSSSSASTTRADLKPESFPDESDLRSDFRSDFRSEYGSGSASSSAISSASAASSAARLDQGFDQYYHPLKMSNEGIQHTEEAQKRDRLTSALSALSIGTDGFLDAEHERDRKLIMIEEIEDLVHLFRDDGEDVDHIKVPTIDDTFETIECTLKILKRHNDRRRFGTLADDCIMLMATSLETLCNGQREWIGFRPDLRGWSNHVRSKLRRMHHDTSQIASSIMNDYNIGPGARLFLELVPNLIMYARDKSTHASSADPNADNPEFDAAIDRLRNK